MNGEEAFEEDGAVDVRTCEDDDQECANVQDKLDHGQKLAALVQNDKLPASDIPRVEEAIARHKAWIQSMNEVSGSPDEILTKLVDLLNQYKLYIEFDLIFGSDGDFLYRQNGQLKLANSILEEFMPRLFDVRLVPGLKHIGSTRVKSTTSFSHLSFGSPLLPLANGSGGVFIKTKNQDLAVTKAFSLTIAETPSTPGADVQPPFEESISVAYFAAEIKTNLDKTMFQEATATAGELKAAVPSARYILLCEWLDMTPITSKLTPIDEVVVLRPSRRLGSHKRRPFATVQGRQKATWYREFLETNPLRKSGFERFLLHLRETFPEDIDAPEETVLLRGYF